MGSALWWCGECSQIRTETWFLKVFESYLFRAVFVVESDDQIGIKEDDTHAKTRALIFETAKKYKLPLAANNRGYFLINTKAEYDEYIKNLNSRIAGIEERKRIITDNYKEKK